MVGGIVSERAEAVRTRAADLASRFSSAARHAATVAQERAILRMLGVDGLDRTGKPLAASVCDRYLATDRSRLSSGLILPFSVALVEYETSPRELALDVASGAIDLSLEAELLGRADKYTAARAQAMRLIAAALARFDANRTAAHEMRDVLGQPPEPWLGVALESVALEPALREIRGLVANGAGIVQVRVPAGWEFAEERRNVGLDTPHLFLGSTAPPDGGYPAQARSNRRLRLRGPAKPPARKDGDVVPAGSQRGLSALREAVDSAAAGRGSYASLMTVTSALAAPEQAVVAAFERVDFVVADPIREIVEENVQPDRALADHAFAHRLHARAGSFVVVGPGPLALGADVASGIPVEATTRAGEALALQALGVEMALADGLPADRLLIGAVPDWVVADGDPKAILTQAHLRALVFPAHRRMLVEPPSELAPGARGAALAAALGGASATLVLRPDGAPAGSAAELQALGAAGSALRAGLGDGDLHGEAAEVAARTLRAAELTLERLAAEGWASVLGPSEQEAEADGFGGSGVVERSSDPRSGSELLAELL